LSKRRFAVLIEDKVDAKLQPDQAERYQKRALHDKAMGDYEDFAVVLCAPRYYLDNHSDISGFEHHISLEQIADILCAINDPRANYKADFLRTVGTKKVNAWKRQDDAGTNAFWDAAYELASRDFRILEMKPLKLTKGTSWITLRPRGMPTMPKYVYVSLKGDKGEIDLTFGKTTAHVFGDCISSLLEEGMAVHQAGESAAIRIKAPAFHVEDGIGAGLPKVKAAFEAASRLIKFYKGHHQELDQYAAQATSTF
jgi:hypothetical protein